MRLFCAIILSVLAVLAGPDTARARSAWTTFASLSEVRALVPDGNTIWAATTGGVVRVAAAAARIEMVYTNVDGLAALDMRSAALDGGDGLIFGDSELGVSRWNRRTGTWQPVILSYGGLQTVDIAVAGSGVYYLAGDKGISLMAGGEIRETYNDFGSLLNAGVRAVHIDSDGYLWAGTGGGIARSNARPDVNNLAVPNLIDPLAWTVYAGVLPHPGVTAVCGYQQDIWVGTENGIARYSGGSWITSSASGYVNAFTEYGGILYAATRTGALRYTGSGWQALTATGLPETDLAALAFDGTGRMWAGMRNSGIAYLDSGGSTWTVLDTKRRGPRKNLVSVIAVDGDTAVWIGGTGSYAVSRYASGPDSWTGFANVNAQVRTIRNDPFGNFWFCTWGSGIYRYARAGSWTHYTAQNSVMNSSDANNPDYPVVNDMLISGNGQVVLCNSGASAAGANGIILTDTSLAAGSVPVRYVNGSNHFSSIARDAAGRMWVGIGIHDGKGGGVLDAAWQPVLTFGEQSGLSNGFVNRIVADPAGQVWIATNSGISMYRDGTAVFGRMKTPYLDNVLLSGLIVHDIDYDSSGNIWAATEGEGVFVLSPDGTILRQYTATSSGLVHNKVNAVAVNRRTGEVWLGTYNGISRFASPFTPPPDDFTGLEVFPNPYKPLEGDGMLCFRGIVGGSRLHIYTASGQLVRTVSTGAADGMTVLWDGRNGAGVPAAAGLYHYVLYSSGNRRGASGAFALVR